MKFVIPGVPQPLARHRDFRRGGVTIHYDPSKKYKQLVAHYINSEIREKGLDLTLEGEFEVNMTFYFPTNVSDSKAVKNEKLWGIINHVVKPDCSNLYKAPEDAANNILYNDDCMIVKGSFEKKYSDNPRTEIEIFLKKKVIYSEMTHEILKMFSPTELKELFNDVKKLATFSDQNLEDDNDDIRRQQLSATCLALADFSDTHADKLIKIKKKKTAFSIGRTIC